MSKLNVLYFIACSVYLVLNMVSAGPASCVAPRSLQANWLADFANKFKQINMCGLKADSKAVMDNEGRWITSYRANTIINSDEEANKLCVCMTKFILQSDWVEGSIHACKAECNSLTVFVISSRNPDFIGKKAVTDTCQPVKVLGSALDRYSNAELGGKNCKSQTGVTGTGQFRIVSECDADPEPEKICAIIYDYLNPDNWLDTTTTHSCDVKDGKLYLEIVEKTILGYCY